MITSYPSIYAIGHKAIGDIFSTEVLIEEKIDGSQFSFKRISETDYEAKSKGAPIGGDIQALFKPAVETMLRLLPELKIGWTYRGEAVCRPKHNTLCYDRAPEAGLILFDIDDGLENYFSRKEKEDEAKRLGLEIVPVLFEGTIKNFEEIQTLLETDSCLGNVKIEGFVVKNYSLFTLDKKVMMGKFVSESFKEKHSKDWKNSNPGKNDVLANLIATYKHENRWAKATQHLRDAGQLKGDPSDIGLLIKEVALDIQKEEVENIKEKLFQWAWKHIAKGATNGLPEWYKEKLAKGAFK
jgi:hypothetical protein